MLRFFSSSARRAAAAPVPARAIVINQTGGPEVLSFETVDLSTRGAHLPGNVVVRNEAIGVNMHDTYVRKGLYKMDLPHITGVEAAGVVERVGSGVTEWKVGDRVAYALSFGSYATHTVVPGHRLVPVPEGVTSQQAAAVLLAGMTAQFLTDTTYPLKQGSACLIHAAAGGTGLLLSQVAKARGATVYGTTSTPEKAKLAKAAGCDEVILYSQTDFYEEVKRLTNGKMLDVVYDGVGKSTWDKSLRSLKPRGLCVFFGNASGPVPPVDPLLLSSLGSLFITRPHLKDYISTTEELRARARAVFELVRAKKLDVAVGAVFPLEKAQEAQKLIESRNSTGKIVLLP